MRNKPNVIVICARLASKYIIIAYSNKDLSQTHNKICFPFPVWPRVIRWAHKKN